jgi:transposase
VFVLRTGISWNQLPGEQFGCSGTTCWRRLQAWTEAGVWPRLHELVLVELRATGQLDLDRCAIDASHVRALKGGLMSGPRRSTAAVPAQAPPSWA